MSYLQNYLFLNLHFQGALAVSSAKNWASKENKAASWLRTLNLVKKTSAISQVNATYQGCCRGSHGGEPASFAWVLKKAQWGKQPFIWFSERRGDIL